MRLHISYPSKIHCPSIDLACPKWDRPPTDPKNPCTWCYAKTGTGRLHTVKCNRNNNRDIIIDTLTRHGPESLSWLFAESLPDNPPHPFVRFHSAGDLLSRAHLDAIIGCCNIRSDLQFWLPVSASTADNLGIAPGGLNGVYPDNLSVRITSARIDEAPAVRYSAMVATPSYRPRGEIARLVWSETYECPGECGACRYCWNPAGIVAYTWHGDAIVRREARKAGLKV